MTFDQRDFDVRLEWREPGVATLVPIFGGSRLETALRIAFLAIGISCLLGGTGYVLDLAPLVFITINLGMGGAVVIAKLL